MIQRVPFLLDPKSPVDPKRFCMSTFWMFCFMHKTMDWRFRKATGELQKVPDDWEQQRDTMLKRLAILCHVNEVPPERVIMADETFLRMRPHRGYTWTATGDNSISVRGMAEKAGVTVMIASDAAGNMLPMQVRVTCRLV